MFIYLHNAHRVGYDDSSPRDNHTGSTLSLAAYQWKLTAIKAGVLQAAPFIFSLHVLLLI